MTVRKIKLLLFLSILLLVTSGCFGQQKPSTFPFEPNPTSSNFEVYSGYGGVNKRTSLDALRTYFGIQINTSLISSTPTLSGNTLNINRFVTHTNGKKYLIDQFGNSLEFNDFYLSNGTFTGNRTVNANAYTYTMSNLGNSTFAPSSNAITNYRWFAGNGTGYSSTSGNVVFSGMYLQGATNILNTYLRVDCYNSDRNDAGLPTSVCSWDAFGKLERHSLSEMLTALAIPDLTFNQGVQNISDVVSLGGEISNIWFKSETTDIGMVFTPTNNLVGGVNYKPLYFETHTFDDNIAEEHGVKIPFVQTDETNVPHENYIYSSLRSFDVVAENSIKLQGGLSQETLSSGQTSGTVQISATCADCTVNNIITLDQTSTAALGNVKFSAYKNTRDDAGIPANVWCSDAQGFLKSQPIADLKTALGVSASESGVFTASASSAIGATNTSLSSGVSLKYTKVGDIVTCFFGFTANVPISSVGSAITLTTLPIAPAANFSTEFDASGSGTFQSRTGTTLNGNAMSVNVRASTTGNKFVIIEVPNNISNAGTASYFVGSFAYKI